MKARKIVLLSLIAVLLCIYIIQLTSIQTGSVKQITLSDEPDRLVLESAVNGRVVLTKVDDEWKLGDRQQYDTLESEVNILVDALRSYSVLQTVSKGGDEVLYGLDDDAKISVTAYLGDTVLCQLDVGKDSNTARQSYIRFADGKDILLVSDSFNSVFNITPDDVRVRNVYSVDPEDITDAALVTTKAGAVLMSRAEDGTWVGNYGEMTSAGIESWISSISMINAAGWLPDDWTPSVEPVGIITFKIDGEVYTNTIYPIEGEEDRYIGMSSMCPYAFYLSSYTTEKFLKTVEDFAQ